MNKKLLKILPLLLFLVGCSGPVIQDQWELDTKNMNGETYTISVAEISGSISKEVMDHQAVYLFEPSKKSKFFLPAVFKESRQFILLDSEKKKLSTEYYEEVSGSYPTTISITEAYYSYQSLPFLMLKPKS